MENGPFVDDFPIKTTIDRGFSMAILNNQMVIEFRVVSQNSQTNLSIETDFPVGSSTEEGVGPRCR